MRVFRKESDFDIMMTGIVRCSEENMPFLFKRWKETAIETPGFSNACEGGKFIFDENLGFEVDQHPNYRPQLVENCCARYPMNHYKLFSTATEVKRLQDEFMHFRGEHCPQGYSLANYATLQELYFFKYCKTVDEYILESEVFEPKVWVNIGLLEPRLLERRLEEEGYPSNIGSPDIWPWLDLTIDRSLACQFCSTFKELIQSSRRPKLSEDFWSGTVDTKRRYLNRHVAGKTGTLVTQHNNIVEYMKRYDVSVEEFMLIRKEKHVIPKRFYEVSGNLLRSLYVLLKSGWSFNSFKSLVYLMQYNGVQIGYHQHHEKS